ncbi:conserved Plasmodium protein, unknown function [Plasmodium chabaudi chabaudi]|uniref:Uncharacterized protein n=1 Tax=Plasmodium chabaudi chabaudi TaxID=31271 RepID=A0A4V0K6H2_PLACU|nr:conserved Plasmodium protein, unknown function [Plasmodium chabaudi chabaudi]VTZ68635.1 conserved Plasmodium protein, unknown function [Plasmodium chabaudi chabaudi]|eukprot:XP_735993.2 conserved Plasmodium protein, unknown function [Plasmodium chabaudi chabaudi]
MMKKLINISAFIVTFLPNVIYSLGESNKIATVVFDTNTINKKDAFQYVYIDKNYHAPEILSSEIGNIDIDNEIHFYKSYTSIISFFKFRPPTNIKFSFKYDGGDLVILKNNKKGIVCKIPDIFHNETGLNFFMRNKSSDSKKGIKYEPFTVKILPNWEERNSFEDDDSKNSDPVDDEYQDDDDSEDEDNDHTNGPVDRSAICEIESDKFLSHKLLCYPSMHANNQIKMSFIKNTEFNNLLELGTKYITKSNYPLIESIITHLKNSSRINVDIKNISYYIFMKTMSCNLKQSLMLSMGIEKNKDENDIKNKFGIPNISDIFGMGNIGDNNKMSPAMTGKNINDFTDEDINKQNKFLTESAPFKEQENNNFVIWKHTNEYLLKENCAECNRILISEGELYNCYGNLENVYEIKISKDNIIDKLKKKKIKYISSVNNYTAYYYDNINYLVILKNYKLDTFFKLNNVLDFVIFTSLVNNLSFYYISNNDSDKILNVYRCSGLSIVSCALISTIPNEDKDDDYGSNIYLSTAQTRDARAVYVSTRNKVWAIKVEEGAPYGDIINQVYVRKVIDSIDNPNEGYFGNINCYNIKIKQYESLFTQFYNVKIHDTEGVGCSYLKHFNDHENILLVSFAENRNFIQRNYHIVRNKNYILSTGEIILDLKISGMNDIFIMIGILICIICLLSYVYRYFFPKLPKIYTRDHEFFANSKNSCPSTVGE